MLLNFKVLEEEERHYIELEFKKKWLTKNNEHDLFALIVLVIESANEEVDGDNIKSMIQKLQELDSEKFKIHFKFVPFRMNILHGDTSAKLD